MNKRIGEWLARNKWYLVAVVVAVVAVAYLTNVYGS